MRARSAQEQVANRRCVSGEPEDRTGDEPLIERELAVKDVAAGQPVAALEVERRDHFAGGNQRLEAGRVLRSSGISIAKRAAAVDRLSAVILLQSYLDSL